MNLGAELLAERLPRGEQKVLAEKLGMDEGYLSRIVRGVRVPGLSIRKLIRDEVGIPLEAWDEPPRGSTGPGRTGTEHG
jgi:transcriptional regulator with XRE-family HTH domain